VFDLLGTRITASVFLTRSVPGDECHRTLHEEKGDQGTLLPLPPELLHPSLLNNFQILAAGVSSLEKSFRICAKLWLALDIVPFRLEWKKGATTQEQAYYNCRKVWI
jgi:hypothetical protein